LINRSNIKESSRGKIKMRWKIKILIMTKNKKIKGKISINTTNRTTNS